MLDDAEGRAPSHQGRGWSGGPDGRTRTAFGFDGRPGAEHLRGVIARQLWWLLLPALLIPLLGTVAISRMPMLYTATGTVIYDPAAYAPDVLQSILKADPTTDTVVASQAAILASLSIAHRLAITLDLAHAPAFRSLQRLPPGARAVALDAAVLRDIAVAPIASSRVFAVSFSTADPGLAAAAANRIMDLYLADQLAIKTQALRAANGWMLDRAAALRRKLMGQDAAIAHYRQRNGLVAGVQARIGTEEMSTLSADLMRAENDLAIARARVSSGGGLGSGMAQNVIAMRQAETAAQAALDEALAQYGPNHPKVRALREQLAALRAATGEETAAARAGVATDAEAAAARLATLHGNLLTLQKETAREAEAEVPLQAMQQDADATRMLLQTLLSRMDQTAQQAAIETPDSRILSRAEPPAAPSSPRRGLLLAASVLAGLVTGCGLAWLRETTATTFRTEAEVQAVLGLPCLGTVPRSSAMAARQLELLRGRLRLTAADPRLLAVTSTRPGEGKSSLALALARAAARAGERVLLVDCDLWRGRLTDLLDAEGAPGLAELLAGRADTLGLARIDAVRGLHFIPAGNPESARRIGDLALKASTEGWRRSYDLIVLDAPPVLASADALLLAEMADSVLLCIRWSHTPRRLVAHACALLGRQGGRSLSVALTRVGAGSRALRGCPEAEIASRRYAAYAGD
ncbi:MAG: polysaccharide biosynthesis tyrosine autokinase [Proteobacteria bacterium]|nr:polysaccharide biosynthesis tyrosine autokinase [Pseudomonadota bacterium]